MVAATGIGFEILATHGGRTHHTKMSMIQFVKMVRVVTSLKPLILQLNWLLGKNVRVIPNAVLKSVKKLFVFAKKTHNAELTEDARKV